MSRSSPIALAAPDGGKTASDESFPVAWLIAPRHRPIVRAYYAFARLADDIADSSVIVPDEKRHRLDRLMISGRGEPQAVALHHQMSARGLPFALATDLLIAFRHDAAGIAPTDWAALMAYCDHSAVPVGRFLLAVHGETEDAEKPADALCRALQVLNHVQDCGEDMRTLGRCYLPQTWLEDADCPREALLAEQMTAPLRAVLTRTLDTVGGLLIEAGPLIDLVRSRGLRAQAAATLSISNALRGHLQRKDPLATRVRPAPFDWMRALVGGMSAGLRP